jgi:putative spermidine/putrescine transport system ATP-binding protein
MSMADRITVLRAGAVEQLAEPTVIYDDPATLFVNQFVGGTNLFPGEVLAGGRTPAVALRCGATFIGKGDGLAVGARVLASVRPEHFVLAPQAASSRLTATVRAVMPLGASVVYDLETRDGTRFKVAAPRESGALALGQLVYAEPVRREACRVFADEQDVTREKDHG